MFSNPKESGYFFLKIGGVKPPKSSILIGFSIINHPFWGKTAYFSRIFHYFHHPFSGFSPYPLERTAVNGECFTPGYQASLPAGHNRHVARGSFPEPWGAVAVGLAVAVSPYIGCWTKKIRGKTPKMDGFFWETLLELMIWGAHPYFWKHPYDHMYLYSVVCR